MFSEYHDTDSTDYLKIIFLYIPFILLVSLWNYELAISMSIILLVYYSINFVYTREYRIVLVIIAFVTCIVLLSVCSMIV